MNQEIYQTLYSTAFDVPSKCTNSPSIEWKQSFTFIYLAFNHKFPYKKYKLKPFSMKKLLSLWLFLYCHTLHKIKVQTRENLACYLSPCVDGRWLVSSGLSGVSLLHCDHRQPELRLPVTLRSAWQPATGLPHHQPYRGSAVQLSWQWIFAKFTVPGETLY